MIKWSSELELGYPEIDIHHRVFLKTINKFLQELDGGIDDLKENLENLLYFLTDYVETHFAEEEAIQKKINYSAYAEHKQTHQKLRDELEGLKRKYWELVHDSSDLFLLKLFISNLKEDLINRWIKHTKNEDQLIFLNYDEDAI
jgi:hemerythrin-like metal-binding protein